MADSVTASEDNTILTMDELVDRKAEIENRLEHVGAGEVPVALNKRVGGSATKRGGSGKSRRGGGRVTAAAAAAIGDTVVSAADCHSAAALIPYAPKSTDTHWDFVMKEMMWLGADFQGERKRQFSLAKKLASSVKQFHKTKETRRLRELHQAEMNRRKLAARIGRNVKGWWTKIEKVVSYKQKLQADVERQAAMNKQLVVLVQQTEKYTESLAHHAVSEDDEDEDLSETDRESEMGNSEPEAIETRTTSDSEGVSSLDEGSEQRRRRRKSRQRMTIEEALAAEHTLVRKTKTRVIDYSRMRLETNEFYGESTASDASGSDGSYSPGEDDSDDDSTLRQAMYEELAERHPEETTSTFLADPEELKKLIEEVDMDVEKVLGRLQQEGKSAETSMAMDVDPVADGPPKSSKHVHFAEARAEGSAGSVKQSTSTYVADKVASSATTVADDPIKYDADDDGDASDVEDYDDTVDHRSDEEYEGAEPEADDETTIAQEESMPKDMSSSEEITLLQRESELSVEDLRALYSNLHESQPSKEEIENENTKVEGGSTPWKKVDEDEPLLGVEETEEEQEEFEPPAVAEADDETTMEAEENLGRDMSHEEEMSMLRRESEIPIDQLRAMYTADQENEEEDEEDDNLEQSEIVDQQIKIPSLVESSAALLAADMEGDDICSQDDGGEAYEFKATEAVDDETTLEAEERQCQDMSYQDELALLKKESEMSVEELRANYAKMLEQDDHTLKNDKASPYTPPPTQRTQDDGEEEGDEGVASDDGDSDGSAGVRNTARLTMEFAGGVSGSEDDGGEEFEPNEAEGIDDETTMDAEERMTQDMSYQDEINLLKQESEMSVEELRKKYANMAGEETGTSPGTPDKMEVDEAYENRHDKRKRDEEDLSGETKKPKTEGDETSEDGIAALNALEASAERAQQTLATRPFLLAGWVKLRLYQQSGLNWLVSLQSRRLNGILADEMGLGKTLQTIALLSYLASYKGIWGPHLIVVPTSVIINWETELKRFCPAFKVLCYYGSAKRRKELRQGWTKTNWYHVVITSYQLAVQDAFAFKRKKWYYLVLDEAQNIKNFQSQRWQTLINFNTQRRLLLTGTPLQNTLMELWSLLHFLMPYIFRSRKEFSYWFSNPMTNMIEGNADRNDDVIKRLHGIIRPFILRRLKKDVEKQMPGKYEHVVKCQLSRRQMTLYEEFLSRSSTRQALTKGGNFMGMMNVLMQLRKVCNHPDLFEPRSVVTPFVLPSLSCIVPAFVCTATKDFSVMNRVSENLIQPIWCGSGGLPSADRALTHDATESEELNRLNAKLLSPEPFSDSIDSSACPDEIKGLVDQVNKLRRHKEMGNIEFLNRTNSYRCSAPPFAYSEQLLSSLEVEYSVFQRSKSVELKARNILLTPEQLLLARKSEQQRADDMGPIIDKFVFCVPPAGARAPVLDSAASKDTAIPTDNLDEMLLEPLEGLLKPYRKAHARLSSFFPDKKLIQFDAGKLQTLAELLRNLKRGGHRALIFTQMSKMLDILEAFLNINGHTYLRLDGSTGVDRRQRYMDRFNNDTKIFCFILSTRSGGMGINLTGADTVIFYDSDWNPAMDAQAQDRAHRIGQTRDVHIYRLITQHSIEENILVKAKQKKNLDIMVMDQGNFDASHQSQGQTTETPDSKDEVKDVYTKGGLRAILGMQDADAVEGVKSKSTEKTSEMSKEEMEKAMASLEDEDDANALRGAQQEAAEELKEFDENAEIKKDSDAEDDDADADDEEPDGTSCPPQKKQKNKKHEIDSKPKDENEESKDEETELEKEFAAWQTSVGFSASAIESSLSPMERYGLLFRENVDPFYSIFFINELRRKSEATTVQDDIDIEEIEREKAMEERQAMDDGDLLGTRPRPESLIRQRNLYQRERSRLCSEKKRRKLTGENWSQKVDGQSKALFWYNEDTGEALWDKPLVLIELEAEDLARKKGWGLLPVKGLVHILDYLIPYPERHHCALVSRQWRLASTNIRFVRHVYPVEMGALSRDGSRRDYNHFGNIDEALAVALPGDIIELSDGHYWVTDAGLLFDKPVKLVGDEQNPANVIIEISGTIRWTGQGGFVEGITLRRPKMTSGEPSSRPMLQIEGKGRVDMIHSVLDNEGSTGAVVMASGTGQKGQWRSVIIRNGGSHGIQISGEEVTLKLSKSILRGNRGSAIHCSHKAKFCLLDCVVQNNACFGMVVCSGGIAEIQTSRFRDNHLGVVQRETGCVMTCSMNTAVVTKTPPRGIPGFRLTIKGKEGIIRDKQG